MSHGTANIDIGENFVGARSRLSKRTLRLRVYALIVVSDCVALVIGFVLAATLRFGDPWHPQGLAMVGTIVPLFLLLNWEAYCPEVLVDWRDGVGGAIVALLIASGLAIFFGFVLHTSKELSRLLVLMGMGFGLALLLTERFLIGRFSSHVFKGKATSVVLINDGMDTPAHPNVRTISNINLETLTASDPVALDRLARRLEGVDAVYVACPPQRRSIWAAILRSSSARVALLMPELDNLGALGRDHFAGVATMPISAGAMRVRDRLIKRAFDLVIALFALVALAPLLTLIAIAITLDSHGPVLFVQQRVGHGNRLFGVVKFRSMFVETCDSAGNASTRRGDERITRIGRFIRRTSIDELPQIINILRGEMSLVGPRPHAIGSLVDDQLFWEVDRRYFYRHACVPGLTGLAQVRGFRGATRSREDLLNRLHADLEYVNGWSIWRDIAIILRTFRVIVHKNAY